MTDIPPPPREATRPVKIDVRAELHGDDQAEAWRLYQRAFTDLNTRAIQRHLLTRTEFATVTGNPRIDKVCAYNARGALVGLATYTRELDAWPLISPQYFARRWPDEYANHRIWYCGFVAVDAHTPGAYLQLVENLYRTAENEHGVICLDVCRHNDEAHHISRSIRLHLRRLSAGRVHAELADQQSFWTYETNGPHA